MKIVKIPNDILFILNETLGISASELMEHIESELMHLK